MVSTPELKLETVFQPFFLSLIDMKKISIFALSASIAFSLFPNGSAQANEGWDAVKTANVLGAADWCIANADNSDKEIYRTLYQGVSRTLEQFIQAGDLTREETGLIQDRVRDQGYYLGLELDEAECTNLKNVVINWAPWQLVTSLDANFSAEMPNFPTRSDTTSTIQGRDFDWILHETFVKPEDSPLLEKAEYYMVGYAKLPQDYLATRSQDEIFDAFGKHIFEKMGFPELQNNEQEITPDGVPARLTSGDAYGQSAATIMYIVDDRFYLTLMVGQERANFERFLRSFEALDFISEATEATPNSPFQVTGATSAPVRALF